MFFKNIAKWSKKLFWGVTIGCYALYFCLVVLAPTITVCIQYDLFSKTTDDGSLRKVTGLALIVIVVFGIMAYVFIKKAITKLPKVSIKEQRFRFGLETIFDCIPLAIALFVMFAVKDDAALAFTTAKICIFEFLAGVLVYGLVIKFIDAEWEIRQAAKLDNEKEKRREVV